MFTDANAILTDADAMATPESLACAEHGDHGPWQSHRGRDLPPLRYIRVRTVSQHFLYAVIHSKHKCCQEEVCTSSCAAVQN